MKLFFFILSLKFLVFGTLFSQSYWFGGLTRLPGGGTDGTVGSFNFGGQSFDHNLIKITDLDTGDTYEPTDDYNTEIGFQTVQIGFEGAMLRNYFELEGGVDLSLSGVNSEVVDIDELYLGGNLKFGGIAKYDFTPNEQLSITSYIRAGLSLEFVTNDLAIPTTYYTIYGPVTTYDYSAYGSSMFNTFFNMRVGTSLRWNKLVSGIAVGKYFPIAGDLSDMFDDVPDQDPIDPLFLQLNLGYEFSESSSLTLGGRFEWYDFSRTIIYRGSPLKYDFEWDGFALDLTYTNIF